MTLHTQPKGHPLHDTQQNTSWLKQPTVMHYESMKRYISQEYPNLDASHFCSLIVGTLILIQLVPLGMNVASPLAKSTSIDNPQSVSSTAETLTNTYTLSEKPLPLSTASKNLTIDLNLRHQFDAMISQHSQNPPALAQALDALAESMMLTQEATKQLIALFERYLSYRKQLTEMKDQRSFPNENADLTDLYHLQREITRLQYSLFNDQEIAAFFNKENRYNQQAAMRMSIRQDGSLSQEQKQQAIAHQVSQLPIEERQTIEASLMMQNITEALHDGRPLPTAISDSFTLNERFSKLQKKKENWNQRVKTYQELMKNTQAVAQTSDELAISKQALKAYLNRSFNTYEQKRLAVYLANPELL